MDNREYVDVDLPDADQVGLLKLWRLPLDHQEDSDYLEFNGVFLGVSTSRREYHSRHVPGTLPPTGQNCSACRWFELRLFRNDDEGRYISLYIGESILPGETPRYRAETIVSAYELIEVLTTVYTDVEGMRHQRLSHVARRALAQAAGHDEAIRQAYDARIQPTQ